MAGLEPPAGAGTPPTKRESWTRSGGQVGGGGGSSASYDLDSEMGGGAFMPFECDSATHARRPHGSGNGSRACSSACLQASNWRTIPSGHRADAVTIALRRP